MNMEVFITGKTMTPPYNHLSNIEFDTNLSMREACPPLSRRHSEVKLPVKYLFDAREEQLLCSPIYKRSKLSITPILRKMTLSETYNFARAQLNSQPLLELRQCKTRTPTLNFNRIKLKATEEKSEPNDFEIDTSTTPFISCKTEKVQNQVTAVSLKNESETLPNQHLNDNLPESSHSLRKPKKKKTKKRKKHQQFTPLRKSGNIPHRLNFETLPANLSLRRKLLPPKTQQSTFITFKSAIRKNERRDEFALASTTPGNSSDDSTKRRSMNQILHTPGGCLNDSTERRSTNQPLAQNIEWKTIRNDDILSSLDSSLNKKAKLSTRIQLIHRYGNEDIITKHRELNRKKEVADKIEKKNLEIQVNTRLKEQQRAKIYALNQLMTKFEQEQFAEFNKRRNS